MSTAIKRVEDILQSQFNMSSYVELVREIFSTVKIVSPDNLKKEFSNFSSHVEASSHVGNYETPDGDKVAIFAVELKQQTYVENARSTQRSYAKKLIENGGCDAALIAFYTPNDEKWRLSFVILDYEIKIEDGKMKTQENLTPARRYSYLVGSGEPCHTAISRLGKFIRDNDSRPTLDEMEDAFSVEAVTKEFFNLYCEKFYQLVDFLESNTAFMEESERCGFSTEQFAKKLMGQIVFLYFLQKKGWLGVGVWTPVISEKDYNNVYWCKAASAAQRQIIQQYLPAIYVQSGDEYKFKGLSALESIPNEAEELIANNMPGDRNWGSGSKTFLRTWFEFASKHNGNFYDNYLEPLFYATLNKNRGELGYSSILHCRIPFLSGGLFEPIDGYDWEHTDFDIPDIIFSNKKSTDDLSADGILDIFDRYNFTMSEDEPMEREVAIDPEMLGKVFENLLDVKDRKSKGAFYTPREIVHYMCQESLVSYLSSNMDISEDAIRNFILYGDFYKDNDTEKTKRVTDDNGNIHYEFDENRELNISSEIFNPKEGVDRIYEIDELLKNIRVADPAVGSGAFPLGMLNEIVRARQNLSAYMATKMSAYNTRLMYINERSAHTLKYETIRNCIFAADIEPSAVDIARLRLWLALVIDDEINPEANSVLDGHKNPLPLPNLDCNIICGNSLVDEFGGVKLIPQCELLNTYEEGRTYSWNQKELETLIPKLVDAQDRLFKCDDTSRKNQLILEIAGIKDHILHVQLDSLSNEIREEYDNSKNLPSRPYVLWQIDFSRVFAEKGGFDVVIGNPPYGAKISSKEKKLYQRLFGCTKTIKGKQKGSTDTFSLFIEKGLNLLKNHGAIESYIVPMSVTSSDAMTALHNIIEDKCDVIRVSSYSNRPKQIFDSACVRTSIIMMKKSGKPLKELYTTRLIRRSETNTIDDIIQNLEFVNSIDLKTPGRYPKIGSEIEKQILEKMFSSGVKLEDYSDESSKDCFYYRAAGGRYFNVITPYPTGSTQELPYYVKAHYGKIIGAILSTSLFWFYQQAYTDGLHIKQSEINSFPLPNLDEAPKKVIDSFIEAYDDYLDDIESNVIIHETSSYNVSTFKEYKIGKSKAKIDILDDFAGKIYNLNDDEINYVKNFELAVRTGDK